MLQEGIQLLVSFLNGDERYIEGVVTLHPANQGAARQAGALPALVGLLEKTGPDSAISETAARCLHALAQV